MNTPTLEKFSFAFQGENIIFNDLKWFNLITGSNGTGKTSMLRHLSDYLITANIPTYMLSSEYFTAGLTSFCDSEIVRTHRDYESRDMDDEFDKVADLLLVQPGCNVWQICGDGRTSYSGSECYMMYLWNAIGDLREAMLLQGSDKAALLLDLPDVYLSPKNQVTLVTTLMRLPKFGIQVFVSTHSYFVLKAVSNCADDYDVSVCHLQNDSAVGNRWTQRNILDSKSDNEIVNTCTSLYEKEIDAIFQEYDSDS